MVAVGGFVFVMSACGQAQIGSVRATSVRLASDVNGRLNGSRPGSDARPVHELLAVNALSPNTFDQNRYSVGVETFSTLKLIDPSMGVFGAIFSPDGRRFVAGGDNGPSRLFDAQTGH